MEEEIEGRHEPHPEAHPVKPALVDVKRKKKKKDTHKKALTWDEHAIEEHDQLRGTRMKIEEPNTPFCFEHSHSSDNESESSFRSRDNNAVASDGLNWNHLENKLGAVAAARETYPSSPSMSSVEGGLGSGSGPDSDFELDKKRDRRKKQEFAMHRKTHYNEMEAVRRWKEEHQDDDDDE
mmetsp:Transcript_22341/g.27387  ORF Transcript_22341/g.27387 Transcript_22341/m.27387 type:complete len:180 (+) Transcript_22341:122-661(+)